MKFTVIVCRVGEEPKVEKVSNIFTFAQQSVLKGGLVEQQPLNLTEECLVALWDEESKMKKLPINRAVPARGPHLLPADFVVDMRDPTKQYAKPGELGYFEVYGNFIITKLDGDGEYVSLTDAEIRFLLPFFELGKCEYCRENPVAYPGARFCGAACSAEWEIHK
jgi:hypothetical protein